MEGDRALQQATWRGGGVSISSHSKLAWALSFATCFRGPCSCRGVGVDDLQRSLPSLTRLCDSGAGACKAVSRTTEMHSSNVSEQACWVASAVLPSSTQTAHHLRLKAVCFLVLLLLGSHSGSVASVCPTRDRNRLVTSNRNWQCLSFQSWLAQLDCVVLHSSALCCICFDKSRVSPATACAYHGPTQHLLALVGPGVLHKNTLTLGSLLEPQGFL